MDCMCGVLQVKKMEFAHLVGTVVVIEEGLHTMDAPLFVFRLHTIYIIVHAVQIECNENMQLLCNMHAYYMHIGACIDACVCPVPIGYMHITLEASRVHWTHAFLLDTGSSYGLHVWGIASEKDGVLRTWWGRWW